LNRPAAAGAGELVELAAQLDGLASQVARNSDGVRSLTSATYRRVDEHAAAIERLSCVSA
jgi:hypothetical protein